MSKFSNKGKAEMPELNTSSLPDLIFSILFFFMIVTSMREGRLRSNTSCHRVQTCRRLSVRQLL